jgi:hypothetical protein
LTYFKSETVGAEVNGSEKGLGLHGEVGQGKADRKDADYVT